MRGAGSAALVALLLGLPRIAEACSGCIARGDDEARVAFVATTVLLTVLPLAVVGGAVWWLLRRAREVDPIESPEASIPQASIPHSSIPHSSIPEVASVSRASSSR